MKRKTITNDDARLENARRLLHAAEQARRDGDSLTARIATTGARQILDEIRADRTA